MDFNIALHALYHYAKKRGSIISLVFLACIFFWVYLFLYRNPSVAQLSPVEQNGAKLPAYLVLNQPDEAVNYWFIRALAMGIRTGIPIELQTIVPQKIHPRSTTIVDDMLVPIGFPGIILLYGSIVSVLLRAVPLSWFNLLAVGITPFLGALAPLFLYALTRRFFDRSVAFMSAVLLWIQPAWWYYSSRPFQHHILLLFLLLCALNACVYACTRSFARGPRALWWLVTGLLWGLALYIRPVEVVWVSAFMCAFIYAYRARWEKKDLVPLAAGLCVAGAIFLATNALYYGTPFGTGYVQPTVAGQAGTVLASSAGLGGRGILSVITLPFGFYPANIWYNFKAYAYHLSGLWFWFFFASIGYLIYEWRAKSINRRMVWCVCALGALGAYLFAYYGSWLFFDNIIQTPSVGSSYARYFLPIALGSAVVIAYALVRVARNGFIFRTGAVFAIILLALSSYTIVFAPLEGLASIKHTVEGYYFARDTLREQLSANAVVVTRYADKYLFPHFQTLVSWSAEDDWQAIEKLLARGVPVFWYEVPMNETERNQVAQFLSAHHLRMSSVLFVWDGLELREIVK
ncbi:MAG: glycosyltransferase family 39 protein [Candidatus Magasanikbacteria bacterium]|nr:glycosyltransferase family 39 protein [Candidatus Magasanikbacteria bacterium]